MTSFGRLGLGISALFLSILFVVLRNVSFADDRTMIDNRVIPEDLYQFVQENGCRQVADFYMKRPGVRHPPYVYGVLAHDEQDRYRDHSAAVWCQRDIGDRKVYSILLRLDGRNWPGGCKSRIDDQDMVGGLTIVRNLDEPLSDYWFVDNKQPASVGDARVRGPVIQSVYDGTGYRYYCHKGKWAARLVH